MNPSWESRIDALYAAVGEPAQLAEALMAFAPEFDTQGAVLNTHQIGHDQGRVLVAGGVSPESIVQYQAHYGAEDEWLKAALRLQQTRVGGAQIGSELVPLPQMQRTRFWREFLLPHRQFDVVSCTLELPDSDAGRVSYLAFVQCRGVRALPAHSKAGLEALAPHARRVLHLHRRLAPRLALAPSVVELYERMTLPMLFIDAAACLVQTNAAAQGLLQQGLLLRRESDGALQLCLGSRWVGAQALLPRLLEEPGFELALDPLPQTQVGSRPALQVLTVQRMHAAFSDTLAEHPAQAVLSLRPASPQQHGALLRQHFGLTAAELRLAQGLAEGLTAQQLAETQGVRLSTVRTHIARLLAKTGCPGQSQLLRRIGAFG